MGLVIVIKGIALPFDQLQGRHTTHFWNLSRGIPGENPELY